MENPEILQQKLCLKIFEGKTDDQIQIMNIQNFEILELAMQDLAEQDIIDPQDMILLKSIICVSGIQVMYPLGQLFSKIQVKLSQFKESDHTYQVIQQIFEITDIVISLIKPIAERNQQFIEREHLLHFYPKIIQLSQSLQQKFPSFKLNPTDVNQSLRQQEQLTKNIKFYTFFIQTFLKKYEFQCMCENAQHGEQFQTENLKIYKNYQHFIETIEDNKINSVELSLSEKYICQKLQESVKLEQKLFQLDFNLQELVKKEYQSQKQERHLQQQNFKTSIQSLNIPEKAQHGNTTSNNSNQQNLNINNVCCKQFFFQDEIILGGNNLKLELKMAQLPFQDHLYESLKKTVCSFLNTQGGAILVGVNTKLEVKGVLMTFKQQDEFKLFFNNNICQNFNPKILLERKEVYVHFMPIKNNNNQLKQGYWIIKINVQPGCHSKNLYTYDIKEDKKELKMICSVRQHGDNFVLNEYDFKLKFIERYQNPQKFEIHQCQDPQQVENKQLSKFEIQDLKKTTKDDADLPQNNTGTKISLDQLLIQKTQSSKNQNENNQNQKQKSQQQQQQPGQQLQQQIQLQKTEEQIKQQKLQEIFQREKFLICYHFKVKFAQRLSDNLEIKFQQNNKYNYLFQTYDHVIIFGFQKQENLQEILQKIDVQDLKHKFGLKNVLYFQTSSPNITIEGQLSHTITFDNFKTFIIDLLQSQKKLVENTDYTIEQLNASQIKIKTQEISTCISVYNTLIKNHIDVQSFFENQIVSIKIDE